MTTKPQKTAADYLAIAVCPALIMLLVGSLVFFLLQVGYGGPWIGRLRWTLFWFVFAMVLVSRIAIQQSPAAAFLYGLLLAGATSLLLIQYLGFIWQVWLLLALIWWAANKITWDCTLIDDDQDASGQGLLQVSRLASRQPKSPVVRAVPAEEPSRSSSAPTVRGLTAPALSAPPGGRYLTATEREANRLRQLRSRQSLKKKQAVHSPGLWVLYFSFAAVPVFGAGELFLSGNDTAGRRFAFGLLLGYLLATFSLLLLTSFLGLRRYLRQRSLRMPAAMASAWISRGVFIMSAILVLGLLLPKPAVPYSLANAVTRLGSPSQEASQRSLLRSSGAQGQSSTTAPTDKGAPSERQNEQGPREEAGQNPRHVQDKSGQPSGSRGAVPNQSLPNAAAHFEKGLSYLIAIVVVAVVVFRYRRQVRDGLRSFFASLGEWWARLLGGRRKSRQSTRKGASTGGAAEAALLPDPFRSGRAASMSMAELIGYTYEATKVWAEARGFKVDQSQTPLELAESIADRERVLTNEILLLSRFYSHVAYSEQLPSADCIPILKRLWSVISFNDRAGKSAGTGHSHPGAP
jgi:hypothetical protein